MNDHNWGGARKGAGRKATGKNTATITLTLTKDQAEMLRLIAEHENKTVSKLVVDKFRLPKPEITREERKPSRQ